MSHLPYPRLESATGATAEIYAQIKKAIGTVPTFFAAIGTHGPAALKAMLAADAVRAGGSLSQRDQETIKLIISNVAGCGYRKSTRMKSKVPLLMAGAVLVVVSMPATAFAAGYAWPGPTEAYQSAATVTSESTKGERHIYGEYRAYRRDTASVQSHRHN